MSAKRNMKTAKVIRPRKNGKKTQRGNPGSRGAMIPHPKQINGYELRHNKTLRFVCKTAFAANITYQNLLDTILFTSSAIAPYDIFYMVRVSRVSVWALPTIGTSSTVSVVFDGTTAGSQGDRSVHTDNSMGVEPAYVSCSPATDTLASKFQITSAANAFLLECPVGAIVDVNLEFHSDTLGVPIAAQNASVGATVGIIAYRGLDGQALAATSFTVPPSVVQI